MFSGYKVAFSKFIEGEREEDLEEMYKECHSAIRADPKFTKKAHSGIVNKRDGNKITTSKGTEYVRKQKLSHQQRKGRVAQKMAAAGARLMAEAEEEE